MRLSLLTEENVDDTSVAKADIVNTINEISTRLVTVAGPKVRGGLGFPEPHRVESESPESPSIVTIEAGKNVIFPDSQPITVTVYGNEDIQIQLTEECRSKLRLHNYYNLTSYEDAIDVLKNIRLAMHEYVKTENDRYNI